MVLCAFVLMEFREKMQRNWSSNNGSVNHLGGVGQIVYIVEYCERSI